MRRPSTIELMLLATVLLWALNLTVTRYILTHGFEPLAYGTIRYGLAAAIFLGIVAVGERTVRIARADLPLASLAALLIFLNQIAFVYALDRTSASTIALILGATPAFAAVIGLAWLGILLVGLPQTANQDLGVGWKVWSLLAFATLGPLVLTTVMWFRVIHRIGASRATLVANLQPFVAAIVALVLLSESMTLLQVLGGMLIAGGILTARRRAPAAPVSE